MNIILKMTPLPSSIKSRYSTISNVSAIRPFHYTPIDVAEFPIKALEGAFGCAGRGPKAIRTESLNLEKPIAFLDLNWNL